MLTKRSSITGFFLGALFICAASTIAAAESACDSPPTCWVTQGQVITVDAGQPIEIEIFGESCSGGDVEITRLAAPDWVANARGASPENARRFVATPPEAGVYQVTFLVTDDENGKTENASVTIEARGVDCLLGPVCDYTPSSTPFEPFEATAGETYQFKFSYSSPCPTSILAFNGATGGSPDFCTVSEPVPDGNGGFCVTVTCTPGQIDSSLSNESHAGFHELTLVVIDLFRDEAAFCTMFLQVSPPDGCSGQPTCGFTNPGPIEMVAGETSEIEFCFAAGCPTSMIIANSNGPLPSFCTMSEPTPASGSEGCLTLTCTPGLSDVGPHQIDMFVNDPITAGFEQCSIQVAVIAPDDCVNPPTCEFVPAGPIELEAGKTEQIEFRWSAGCELSTANLLNPMLLSFCSMSAVSTDSEGNSSVVITCEPTLGDLGMHTQELRIQDNFSLIQELCSIEIEVVEQCTDPPICSFSTNGPIKVNVGEPIDLEFCGVAACNDHRARIEMYSRPPFITPAGHQKGSPGEELCLPIQGTPQPGDEGNWRVRVRTTDLDTGIETECELRIIVNGPSCPAPICTVGPSESMSAVRGQQVMLTACGLPGCLDGSVRVEAITLPEFCDPFDPITGEPGDEVCVDISCTIPMDTPDGEYPVVIRVTDLDSGQFTDCGGAIIVGPPPACIEEEPNNELALCTVLDAQTCLNIDCGAFIAGYLDDSGDDVDFYCIDGLQPNGFYDVLVINGVSCDLEPTCAMAVCVDDQGTRVGPGGSQGSECIADENGTLLIGVTGCGDYDLDGQADDDVEGIGGIGHGGRGSYQLLFSLRVPSATNDMACHADMNGDGMVDAADLGMMIGVFGEVCAP